MRTLNPIPKFDGPMIPDPKWERVGADPVGRQLYRERQKRSRAVPLFDEETGERVHQKHQNTGQKLYPMNRPELFTLERVFYLESEGNGNVRKVPYTPPTPEEIAAAERKGKIESMKERVAEVFVDADISPEDLLEFLRSRPYTPQSEIEEEQEEEDLPFVDSTARRAEAEAEAQAEADDPIPEPTIDEPTGDIDDVDELPSTEGDL